MTWIVDDLSFITYTDGLMWWWWWCKEQLHFGNVPEESWPLTFQEPKAKWLWSSSHLLCYLTLYHYCQEFSEGLCLFLRVIQLIYTIHNSALQKLHAHTQNIKFWFNLCILHTKPRKKYIMTLKHSVSECLTYPFLYKSDRFWCSHFSFYRCTYLNIRLNIYRYQKPEISSSSYLQERNIYRKCSFIFLNEKDPHVELWNKQPVLKRHFQVSMRSVGPMLSLSLATRTSLFS